jgi:hypothetical protein
MAHDGCQDTLHRCSHSVRSGAGRVYELKINRANDSIERRRTDHSRAAHHDFFFDSAARHHIEPGRHHAVPLVGSGRLPRRHRGCRGSVYRVLVFTNRGSQSCELQGFPGVSYVAGDDGHQVGPAATRTGDRGEPVHIAPGGTASAQLRQVNVANFDPAVCQPTPVRGLRVYPPGETAAIFVPLGSTGCAGTPSGPQLTVQAITAS